MPINSAIVIAGPTASGKSGLALDVAEALGGEIINADSMQVYQGMPVLSAVPCAEDRKRVPHRLYEIFSPAQNGSVVEWLNLAVAEIQRCHADGKIPVLAGGTGLYIDNLISGTTPIPEVSADVRRKVMFMIEDIGVQELHRRLEDFDKESFERLSPNDTTRVRRAWEVWLDTGRSLSAWHKEPMIKRLPDAVFTAVKILPEKAELDERCNARFDLMMEQGALQEAQQLHNLGLDRALPAMKALGVPELFAYLDGEMSLDAAAELAKLHTRQYAKRQRTWFASKPETDLILKECYKGQKNIINDVKKRL